MAGIIERRTNMSLFGDTIDQAIAALPRCRSEIVVSRPHRPDAGNEKEHSMNITVDTSCGQTFHLPVTELTEHQLHGLLEQNSDRTDVDPSQIAAMRAELRRRAEPPIDEMSPQQIRKEIDGYGYQPELLPPDKWERYEQLCARLGREEPDEDEETRVERYRRGNYPAQRERPTVTLIISTDGALIGCAPFGAAVTNRNKALSEEVRELLRKYGYSECELVLDANESLEKNEAPIPA
jgi:hypothetical protein